jgi:HPt (histidine-containing phosphotransfer) domain-containing protein
MNKLYSVDKIMVYVGDQEDQCAEMIDLFLQTIPDEFIKLEEAIRHKSWKKAYEISHRIKPSIQILDIKNATSEFMELDAKLHQQIELDSLNELFLSLHKNINIAFTQIREDYNR